MSRTSLQTLRGHLNLVLLVSLRRGPRSKQGLVEAVRTVTCDLLVPSPANVYVHIRQLTRDGWVAVAFEQTWDAAHGVHHYALTRRGDAYLDDQRQRWPALTRALEVISLTLTTQTGIPADHGATGQTAAPRTAFGGDDLAIVHGPAELAEAHPVISGRHLAKAAREPAQI